LKKPAIPAIVLYLPHKQAENSMAGCCNNLPYLPYRPSLRLVNNSQPLVDST
jgi:hypothetical protein